MCEQVAQGASVILTQPVFDLNAFENWLVDAERRGLTSAAKILIGMPFLSSPGNLAFWLSLANCAANPASQKILANFQRASAKGKSELVSFCRDYNQDLVMKLLNCPGISGLHVMPITTASKKMALESLRDLRINGIEPRLKNTSTGPRGPSPEKN